MPTTRRLAAFLLLCAVFASAKTTPAQNEYADLLSRLKSGDTSVDFAKLRLSWVDSPEYQQAKDTDTQKKAMLAALNAQKFDEALKNAEVVLASNYVDIDAHYAAYLANRELHHDQVAEFHKAVVQGLLKSITDSGDGKTPEHAYVVITVDEEYVVLRFMHLMPASQSLQIKNGHSYDKLDAKDPQTGGTQTLYFNVDIPMKHYGI